MLPPHKHTNTMKVKFAIAAIVLVTMTSCATQQQLMAEKKLRALLEFAVQGDRRAQRALNDLSESGKSVEKGMQRGSSGTKLMDIARGNFVAGNLLKAQGALVNFGLSSIQAASDVEQDLGEIEDAGGEEVMERG